MDFERDWNVDAAADRQQAHDPELAALAARVKTAHAPHGSLRTVSPNAEGVVVLPAGTDINKIEVDGRNLIVHLPDGTELVILDGAVAPPRIVVGDIEIPSVNLAALLIGAEPQPAAGPARSSGGNFLADDGAIGDPFALGDLLPPTELLFTQPEEREILPIAPDEDDIPEVRIVTPNQPAGATDATAGVSEAGLPARNGEPAGSAAGGGSEQTSGTIVFSAADGPVVVTINGVAVTGIDQPFTTPFGTLIITSIGDGVIGYRYVLADNVVGQPPADIFTVVVTDNDGDQATATLTISIADDAPVAMNDFDSVTEDGPVVADGNLFTGMGGTDANSTDGVADVQGADGASVTTTGTFMGTYGTLIISAGGGYIYTLANDNPAVQFLTPGQTLTDSFSYTITDADGSTSSATLTITINGADDGVTITGLNGEPGAGGAELVVLENDLSDGSSPDAAALTQAGSFGVSGADGLTTVTVGGVTVLNNGAFVAGQTVTTPLGTLTITGFTATAQQGGTPTAGTFTYSFVLTDNSLNHDAAGADSLFQNFAVVATDRNGSTATGSIDVQIVDDLPTARPDVDGVAAGTYGPEGGNVITGEGTVSGAAGADTEGADGAAVAGVAAGAVEGAPVDAETVGHAVQGLYGRLTLNADGSYSYVRDAGTPGGVSDSFTYTLRDGDGDLSVATLRIDIADSGVMITSVPRVGEGTVVDEAGLDAGVGAAPGSNAAANVEMTAGVITYSAPDAPSTVTINGQLITHAGQTVDTDKGTLTIVAISEGRIEYSYTLTTNTTGDDVTDSFVVTVTDVDGDSATDTLVITILDDHPTAMPDFDSVREDGPLVADGNVLTGANVTDANDTDGVADIQGADGASVTGIAFGGAAGVVGEPLSGAYGSLTILPDGRYTYTLNNANGVVQGLDSTEHLTEIFTYTITDGDTDNSSATITIRIDGSNDGVTITGLSGEGAEQIVYEDDLADGSSPDAGALTRTGSFDVTALDGVTTITVGGQTIFNGSFVAGVTISNAYGTLKIDNFAPTVGADGDVIGGTVSYTYVLNDNAQHLGGNDVSLIDSFAVVVRDTDNSEATASLDVQVFDDAPMARDDVAAQASENAAVQFNVITGAGTVTGAAGADTLGADGVDLTVAGGKLVVTSGPTLGTVVYQGNGQFLYTPNPGAEGQDSFTYTITDGDGDSSTATVKIQLAGDSRPTVSVDDLTVSEAGLPNGSAAAGNSETASGSMTIATGGDTLAKVEVQDKNGAWIDVTGATVGAPIVVQGAAGNLTVTSDGLGHYSYSYTLVVNNPTHPDFDPNDGDGISGAADTLPGDSFGVRVTDSDGDVSAVTSIDVTVQDDAPSLDVTGPTSVVEGATVNGTWTQVVGADQPGHVTQVVFNGATYALGAAIDTGKGVLTVNANGTWSFAAANNLNQSVAQSISFTVKVTDADNDVAQDVQTISIDDGAVPTAGPALSLLVDDQNLADGSTPAGPDFQSGNVSFTAGSDALTGFAFSTNLSGLVGGLTWNRVSATLIEGWDGPVGTGTKIVQLTLTPPASIGANSSGTAQVTATLLNNYAHHPLFTQDDTAQLGNVGVVASDQDGDSATATVNVAVSDDVPTIDVTGPTSVVEGATVNGTWTQVVGADQPGHMTQVVFNGATYALGTAIDTGKGVLTVNANGTWTFAAANNLNQSVAQSISFTVKVTDADNDVAQDVQTIGIDDGAVPTAGPALSLLVDDQNLADGSTPAGPDFQSGNVSFTAGSDALTGFAFSTNLSGLVGGLTWNRVSATLIEGWDGPVGTGTKIVQLTLTPPASIGANSSGTAQVTATLLNNYAHHPLFTQDDTAQLGNVGVVASDQDGDSATATVNVAVSDDVPTIDVTGPTSVVEGASVNGTWTQVVGADQPGHVTQVVFNGATYALGAAIDTGKGVLTVNANGTWTFAAANNLNQSVAQSISFTVKVTDADNDVAQDVQTISIDDGANPTATKNAAMIVDEEALGTVNATGTNAASNAETSSDTVTFQAGSDNITSVAFTTVAGITADVNGVAGSDIVWSLDSGTQITGRIGGIVAITLTLTPPTLPILSGASGSATITATISDNFPHPFGGTGDILITGVKVTATDTDSDAVNATAQVTVIDDAPLTFAPIATTLTNAAGQSATRGLDVDSNINNNIGADQPGSVTFANITNGQDTLLKSGGTMIELWLSNGGTTLQGRTGSTNGADGTLIYTVQLNQSLGTYTTTIHQAIDNGSGASFNDLSGGVAGNPPFKLVASSSADNLEILFTPINAGSVNSDSDDIGVDGQFIDIQNPDAGIRLDFGDFTYDANGGGPSDDAFFMNSHQIINGFKFTIDQVSNGTTADVRLHAYNADEDGGVEEQAPNPAGDVDVAITMVKIFNSAGALVDTVTADKNVAGGIVVDFEAGGTVLITGLTAQYKVQTYTASGYDRIEITNAGTDGGTDGKFSLSQLQVETIQTGNPVNLAFDLSLTDSDGDKVTVSNAIAITANPVPPVALDLDGDGLEFLALSAGVHHDYGAGLVGTAWVAPDDGLLAHAVGGSYDIVFSDDAPGAMSDLEGLRLAYDSNGDGVFDARDAAFAEFGVWQDLNSNGQVDAGEFKSLTDAGIASIDLTSDGRNYGAAGGDVTVLGEASFTRTDGSKGAVGDVLFATAAKENDAAKVESVTSGFNQALIAASLVAVAGAAETVEQEPAPVVAQNEATVDSAPAATTSTVSEPANDDGASLSASSEGQDGHVADQPVEQASHGSDDAAPDHSTLSGGGDAAAPAANDDGQAQPALDDHQGLLAQTVDLPTFDGNAAALVAAHEAAPATVAEVVTEALGTADAPIIDTMLAALPVGDHAPVAALFNPVGEVALDSGHMAAAVAALDAAMVAHEAMAVAHG